jgi:hypothetical protein
MGLEAACLCRIDETSAEAKVLLEALELIIRSPFRRTIRIADLQDVHVVEDELRFRSGTSTVALRLGRQVAAKWANRIATPPPSLARKLGVGPGSPALVVGGLDEPILIAALAGHTADAARARLSLALIRDAAELDVALTAHAALKAGSPIWIVHGKGPAAAFGEALVRSHMRARGFRDTKVSAVSSTLTATRYGARAPDG